MAEFRIALGAGHRLGTPGKHCLKTLDPKETPEWWLNDRVCDYVEELLKNYEGYELLRVDDTNGEAAIDLAARVNAANRWKADYFLAVHHNAGIRGGTGGGIVVYRYPGTDAETVAWQNEMYDALIAHTGLRGNRANPKPTAELYVLTATRMPATLLELGFMDSRTDVPVILTDDYAHRCAEAIVEVLVKRGGLKKRQDEPAQTVYKVQVGAFGDRVKARELCDRLIGQGYSAYILRG
ncbi:MAG: N-acetylmuramoyl-L-alanine amidase [Oscillospiraceae bacterium]|nr:N-acetylmuramoyl-L-alanine amidase [Oscillospiraceae bacterium]